MFDDSVWQQWEQYCGQFGIYAFIQEATTQVDRTNVLMEFASWICSGDFGKGNKVCTGSVEGALQQVA
eukprot:13867609-Ditylum_brightwellii.AAC.1